MYVLAIEPAKQPIDFNAAMRELYTHAQHRLLQVVPQGEVDGTRVFSLRNPRTNTIESIARISEAC